MCKVVVEVALARFSDPAMRQQIVDDLNAACETMDTPEGRVSKGTFCCILACQWAS